MNIMLSSYVKLLVSTSFKDLHYMSLVDQISQLRSMIMRVFGTIKVIFRCLLVSGKYDGHVMVEVSMKEWFPPISKESHFSVGKYFSWKMTFFIVNIVSKYYIYHTTHCGSFEKYRNSLNMLKTTSFFCFCFILFSFSLCLF